LSKTFPIRSYDYVNFPYEKVRDALRTHAVELFHEATRAATDRANTVVSELRVDLGGFKVSTDVAISVKGVEERPSEGGMGPSTVIRLEWEAAKRPHLFPFMKAELTVYPLTKTETQLDFSGVYEPPLGPLGSAINAVIGQRLAESSVLRFVQDVARHLRATL
jgi:hypothetical protein